MKLYYAETTASRKPCAVARHLESPVELIHVNLAKGEQQTSDYAALNPNRKVPVLTDGERRIWESNAIMCYLAQKAGSDLWPRDAERQIEIIRWLAWNDQHFSNYGGTLAFEHIVRPALGMGTANLASIEESLRQFRTYAAVLNDHLRGRRYLVGDGLTVADFAVAVALPYAERAHIPLDDFPEVRRWHDRMNELPAWREPFPSPAILMGPRG